MDSLLSSITAVFSTVKWTGETGKYRADFSTGYIQVTERVKMDGTRGEIAFYVSNPQKRQIFSFGWRNREKREMTILRAYCEIHEIHNAIHATLGAQ